MGEEKDDLLAGLPPGTKILRDPDQTEENQEVGFPEGSELIERHGRHFHLVEGSHRLAIEVTHFVERRKGFFKEPDLAEERTVYLLPKGVDLGEARKIGYRLLEEGRFDSDSQPQ